MAEVTRVPRQIPREAEMRLQRLRRLAWLLDRSVGVGKARFGLDPILGLIPGLGDWAGAAISLYIVYEAMRLGLSWPVLARMIGNIAFESLLGAVPVAGDVFDFFWQSNTRNLQLIDRHYRPSLAPRSLAGISVFFAAIVLFILGILLLAIFAVVWLAETLWEALAN